MADVGKVNTKAIDDIGKINLMTVPAAGMTYADYEYEADLAAAGTTYTPPASTFFGFFTLALASVDVNLEWYDSVNTAWYIRIDLLSEKFMLHQSDSQHLRLINDDPAAAHPIGLYGVTWTGFSDYEYETDLAGGANYVPPAKTFFTIFTEVFGASDVNIEWYALSAATWYAKITTVDQKFLLHQSTNRRLRVMNDSGSARAIGLFGATWT